MAKSDPGLDRLAQVDLFRDLSRKELEAVYDQAKEMRFAAGDVIAAEGEPGGRFHLVLDGTARVDVHGDPRRTLGPGDAFGEMSLIDDEPRSASVVAETDVRTLSITGFNFRPLLNEHPPMAIKLLQQLSRRLREVERAQEG